MLDHFCSESEPNKENKNWMKNISDSTKIYLMSIPGTHNSCALYGTFLAQCQSWSINYQLNAGIRYFDLRLRLNENKLELQHGPIYQNIEFSDILKVFSDFLKENNTEFIIMAIQEEFTPIKKDKSFKELFDEKIEKYKNKIVYFSFENEINYSLGELRGKILFIELFDGKIHRRNGIKVQNEWVCNYKVNIIDKKRKIKRFFNKSITLINMKKLFINYLSASSDYLLISPSEIAKNTNKEVFKFKGRLGIVLCDFPGENLISHLIDQNNNIDKILNEQILFASNNCCVIIKNLITGKFLSFNDNNELICSKNPYNFVLYENCSDENKMIKTNDEITLIGNKDLNLIIIKDIKLSRNKEFDLYIYDSDIIKLITNKDENLVLSSDFEFKGENKIQKVEINKNGNNQNQNWVINIIK